MKLDKLPPAHSPLCCAVLLCFVLLHVCIMGSSHIAGTHTHSISQVSPSCSGLCATKKAAPYCWWNTFKGKYKENIQEIYKEYSRNICRNIQEYVRNTYKYLWKQLETKEHRGAAFGGAPNGTAASWPPHWVCVLCFGPFYIINIYGYPLYIPFIYIS